MLSEGHNAILAGPSTRAESGESGGRTVAINRFTIEDGTLFMRDVRENLEGTIKEIQLTASIPAQGPLDVNAQGKAGEQILRLSAKAQSLSQIVFRCWMQFMNIVGMAKRTLHLFR